MFLFYCRDWESTLKIKLRNQLVYEYLKAMDVSTIANDFKGHVQQTESHGLNFSYTGG